MFLKYRILSKLEFGEFQDLRALHRSVGWCRFKRFSQCVDQLGRGGFLSYNDARDVSLYCYSSLHEYLVELRKAFFEFASLFRRL